MKGNIQFSTFNAQLQTQRETLLRGKLKVAGWAGLFLAGLAVPLAAQSPTNGLPALAPPYGEIPQTFWEQHGIALLVVMVAVLALTGVALWTLLRPPPPALAPPATRARETLAKLQRQPESGEVLSGISQALRRYFTAVFHLPPHELTTAEFSSVLANQSALEPELARSISSFLIECDQRKFSPGHPAPPLEAAGRALEIVSQIEQRRAEPGVNAD
jgi:hypothetical protein